MAESWSQLLSDCEHYKNTNHVFWPGSVAVLDSIHEDLERKQEFYENECISLCDSLLDLLRQMEMENFKKKITRCATTLREFLYWVEQEKKRWEQKENKRQRERKREKKTGRIIAEKADKNMDWECGLLLNRTDGFASEVTERADNLIKRAA